MARAAAPSLAIDARPRGPHGPLAGERVGGRTLLARLVELADETCHDAITVHVAEADLPAIAPIAGPRVTLATSPPGDGPTLRVDRLYDRRRLRRALRRGLDPETAVLWRLDGPDGLAGAEDELKRRLTYQPLGRYWSLAPARALARALAPTSVRPNAVTCGAAAMMLVAAYLVAFVEPTWPACLAAALAIAAALVLDTADGHLARLQGTASPFGRWLDAWLDEATDMALHAAIAWSAFTRSGLPAWLLAGMVYGMAKYVFLIGQTPVEPAEPSEDQDEEPDPPSPAREAVRLMGHADIRLHLWILLAAFGRLDAALAVYAVYFPARAALGLAVKWQEARDA